MKPTRLRIRATIGLILAMVLMFGGCVTVNPPAATTESAPVETGPSIESEATEIARAPQVAPAGSQIITVALDYFGTKSTLAKIQLVVLVKDEERTLAQQAIPPEEAPGFDMSSSQVKDIKTNTDPVVYKGPVAGSLTVYIGAYDVSSGPILKTNLEVAAKYFGVPGASALKDAIPDKKLVGHYWHTWTESSNWGIGTHKDVGEGDLRLWLRVWSDQVIEPVQLPAQEIRYTMPPGSIAGSMVSYSRELNAGDTVEGTVQLTGQFYSTDWSYKWAFEIVGPGGDSLREWAGHWEEDNHHDFSFTAPVSGIYTLKVNHASTYKKELAINIWPPGWVKRWNSQGDS